MIDWFESTIIASFEKFCVHELDTPCALANVYGISIIRVHITHSITHSFPLFRCLSLSLSILHGVNLRYIFWCPRIYCLCIQSASLTLSLSVCLCLGMHTNFAAHNFLSSISYFSRFIFKLKYYYLRNNSILEPFIYFKSQWIWLTN